MRRQLTRILPLHCRFLSPDFTWQLFLFDTISGRFAVWVPAAYVSQDNAQPTFLESVFGDISTRFLYIAVWLVLLGSRKKKKSFHVQILGFQFLAGVPHGCTLPGARERRLGCSLTWHILVESLLPAKKTRRVLCLSIWGSFNRWTWKPIFVSSLI